MVCEITHIHIYMSNGVVACLCEIVLLLAPHERAAAHLNELDLREGAGHEGVDDNKYESRKEIIG